MLRLSSLRMRRQRKALRRCEHLEPRHLLSASSILPVESQSSTFDFHIEGELIEASPGGTTSVSGWLHSSQGTPMAGVQVELGGMTVYSDDSGFFIFEFEPHQIPTATFSISVPRGDPWFDPFNTGSQSIPMQRALYGELSESGSLQHPNLITSFIDASMVYGSDDARAAALRSGVGGKLKVSTGNLLPINNTQTFPDGPLENDNAGPSDPSTLYAAGDVRANENVGLLSLHTLLVREHNRLADQLAAQDPGLSDEELYQQARRLVGAMVQHITYNEYLPVLLGEDALPAYTGYDQTVDPAVSTLFSGAAFRVGHTQLIPNFQRLDANNQPLPGGELPLRFAFFNASAIGADGIEPYLRGLYATLSQEVDPYVIDDVRNFLFGPPGSGGMDLASINIQRGRDLGLPSYNQARLDFGLPAVTSFAEITSDPVIAAALASVYDNVDQIDVWVGGLAEDHAAGSQVGPLFQNIIADQFTRSRDGDRYWYENGQFTSGELSLIRSTTLAELMARNSSVTGISGNAFTTATAPAGPAAAGTAASETSTDYRSISGYGNNLLDPSAGATHDYLATNFTTDFADGTSQPGGTDRPGAREVSNAVIAQQGSIANSSGTTGLFIFWGQLLDHDLGLTPGGTSDTLTIHGDQWIDPAGYQAYQSTSMPLSQLLGSEIQVGIDNESAYPVAMQSAETGKQNVFAHFHGEVENAAPGVVFDISLTSEQFSFNTNHAVVGWKVIAEDGSELDPAVIEIRDQQGNLIPLRMAQDDVAGSLSSYAIAEMVAGDYQVTITSQNQTVGAFHVEASLTGDFNGDRRVGALDLLRILDAIGFNSPTINPQLDLDLDGQVTSADLDMAIANFRNGTTLNPMYLSSEVDPGSNSSVTFRGQTLPGNDIGIDTNSDGVLEDTIIAGPLSGGFNFVYQMLLSEGTHQVTISASDPFGQKAEVLLPLTIDTVAPSIAATSPGSYGVDEPEAESISALSLEEEPDWNLTAIDLAIGDEDLFDPLAA